MDGDTEGQLAAATTGNGDGRDVGARRAEIVARLLERGIPVRALQGLLPGWDDAIETAANAEPAADGA